MLNQFGISPEIGEDIRAQLPECFRFRAQTLTAEEMFYALQLLKFKAHNPSSAIYYLTLKLRVKRYLLGQDRALFTEQEWESLARLWKVRFIQFCLKKEGIV